MGNRAVIAFDKYDPNGVGIYLHWNGGRDSVEAFLEAGLRLKIQGNHDYTVARFAQMVGNFFGGTSSIGVGLLSKLDCDNHDNGVYVVDSKTFEIKERKFFEGKEQRSHDAKELVAAILEKNQMFLSEGLV